MASPVQPLHLVDDVRKQEVQNVMDRFAEAITQGDGKAAAKLWSIPAYVLGDHETRAVLSSQEVAEFFGQAKEQYNSMGVVSTEAEIISLEWITNRMALVQVRWPRLNADGAELSEKRSTYVLRANELGQLKIHAALMMGERQ